MVELYKLELISNGRVFKIYQDENIETVFEMVAEEFDGLQDLKHDCTLKLIDRFFTKKEITEMKENNIAQYQDMYICIQDYISTDEYKKMFNDYFSSIDNVDFKVLEIEY